MTQEADDHIILSDVFQNTHKIHMNQSRIFRKFVLKKIGKIKTIFCTDQLFHFQKYFPKMDRKKLRGIKIMTSGFYTPKCAEFSSFNEFGHHQIGLYPVGEKTPHFSSLKHWSDETMAIWISKDSK
jgi:hypothetical protein